MATPVADKIRCTGGVENCKTPSRSIGEDVLQFLDLLLAAKV